MGWLCRREGCRADEQGASGMEGDTLALCLGCGMAKSVVAHCAQAARQDVTQVAFDKLPSFHRVDARGIALGAILPAETDVGISYRNDA